MQTAPKTEWGSGDLMVPIPPSRYRMNQANGKKQLNGSADYMDVEPRELVDMTVPLPPSRWAMQINRNATSSTPSMNQGIANGMEAMNPSRQQYGSMPTSNDQEKKYSMMAGSIPSAPQQEMALPVFPNRAAHRIKSEALEVSSPNKRPLPIDTEYDMDFEDTFQPKRRISIQEEKYTPPPTEVYHIPDEFMTVLIASPLCANSLHPCKTEACSDPHTQEPLLTELPLVDIQVECEVLSSCLLHEDDLVGRTESPYLHIFPRVHMQFELATLSTFEAIIQGSPHVLHIVAHGNDEGLFLDDLCGRETLLPWSALQKLFFGSLPLLIVVSSTSPILGTKFADAGVPHVVWVDSTYPTDTHRFFKLLYRQLQEGKNIDAAFKDASLRAGHIACALLPSAAKCDLHSIPVFPKKQVPRQTPIATLMSPRKRISFPILSSFTGFPRRDMPFVERSRELHNVVQHLLNPLIRFVNVQGPPRTGKSALVCAAAQYIHIRGHQHAIYISSAADYSNIEFLIREISPPSICLIVMDDTEKWTNPNIWNELFAICAKYPHVKWLTTSDETTYIDGSKFGFYRFTLQPLSLLSSAKFLKIAKRLPEDVADIAALWEVITARGLPGNLILL